MIGKLGDDAYEEYIRVKNYNYIKKVKEDLGSEKN